MGETAPPVDPSVKISATDVDVYYGKTQALHGVSLKAQANRVTALIGPSGCGKSTFLRSINRMNDLIAGTRFVGRILLDGEDIYDPAVDVVDLRRRAHDYSGRGDGERSGIWLEFGLLSFHGEGEKSHRH